MEEQDKGLLNNLFSGFKGASQQVVLNSLGINQLLKRPEVKKIGEFNQLNDPQGRYLYCLDCGVLN